MVQLLHTFQKNLGARISWHYSATSHGKGAVDGVGGTLKGQPGVQSLQEKWKV